MHLLPTFLMAEVKAASPAIKTGEKSQATPENN